MIEFSPYAISSRIRQIRLKAAYSLAESLEELNLCAFSEEQLCNSWHLKIKEDSQLASYGWYVPPPKGISVLIGAQDEYDRTNYKSLRHEEKWPGKDIIYKNDNIIYAYASPFDKNSGLIGDIGVTLYNGASPLIHGHLNTCLEITKKIADFAQVGQRFCDLFNYGMELIGKEGLMNQTFSITDPDGLDIGHTVPFSYSAPSPDELQCLVNGSHNQICKLISSKRRFINRKEEMQILPNIAFTIEPRLASSFLPLSSYHVIVIFCEGEKIIVSGFNRLFAAFKMDNFISAQNLFDF